MRRWKIVVSGILLVSLVAAIGIYLAWQPTPKKKVKTKPKITKKKQPLPKTNLIASPLDGIKARPELVNRQAIAVMVENLDAVRPQAGIPQASMVVEALSEGGITRFMLVYLEQDADNIGPVRSARSHYVALAKGLNARYAHAGGSKFALEEIRRLGIDDVDEFAYPKAYHRVKSARAPHNVYTSTSDLRKAKPEKNTPPPAFAFKKELEEKQRPSQQKVTIDFSFPEYAVEWIYQPKNNNYQRLNGGKPHKDGDTGEQLEAKNILIMVAPTAPIEGTTLLDINTVGSGRLRAIRDGTVVEGVWSRPTIDEGLTITDNLGNDIELNPGQVWLEIVTPTTSVNISGAPAASSNP